MPKIKPEFCFIQHAHKKRFAVRFKASESEYESCTSDPVDLARLQAKVQQKQQNVLAK